MSEASRFPPRNPDFAVAVRDSFNRQGLMATIGARLTKIEPGFCRIDLPYSEAVSQQHGYFHGGAIGAIADSAGGYAGFSLMDAGHMVLTVEYKLNLLAAGQGERIFAVGEVIKPGRTLTVTQIEVFAIDGERRSRIAAAQQTLIGMPAKAGSQAG